MGREIIKEGMLKLLLSIGAIGVPYYVQGQQPPETPQISSPSKEGSSPSKDGVDECSIELLRSYFPEKFVSITLEKYNVPQEKRAAIIKELAARNKEVTRIVEEKASKLNPNPFKDRDPKQRQAAIKIFRETLLQIMTEVLNEQGIKDEKQIQEMLDNINREKALNFSDCLRKQKLQIPGLQGMEGNSPSSDKMEKDKSLDGSPKPMNTTGDFKIPNSSSH